MGMAAVDPAARPTVARMGLTPLRALGLGGLALLYLVALPLYFADSNYILSVIINATLLSFISLGVWLTFAIGRINISQGAYTLIGGYATAILSTRYGLSFWLCLPLSGLIAAAFGAAIGAAILRLRGVYFAMITLSLTEAVRLAFLNGGEFTRGAGGIVGIPRPGALSVFGITLVPAFAGADSLSFYYLGAALLILGLLVVWRIHTSRLGWVFRSMRQNEDLAESIGINVAKYRILAYAVCCALGGMGGSFFAAYLQNIYPSTYSVTDSVYFMLYCFLGGLDFIFGAVAGAFLLVISFELLHDLQEYQALIYGLVMISFILWLPNGILSLSFRRGALAPDEEVEVPRVGLGAEKEAAE
jgi:branched-chain amino acid transport system permease protein